MIKYSWILVVLSLSQAVAAMPSRFSDLSSQDQAAFLERQVWGECFEVTNISHMEPWVIVHPEQGDGWTLIEAVLVTCDTRPLLRYYVMSFALEGSMIYQALPWEVVLQKWKKQSHLLHR